MASFREPWHDTMSSTPLRILYVNHVGLISGAEKSLLRLLEGLDREQVEPLLAAPEGPLLAAARLLAIPCFPIPELRPRRTRNPLRLLLMAWRGLGIRRTLHRLIKSHDVTLAHANSLVAGLLLTSQRMGVPMVWHARDLRAPESVVRQVGRKVQAIIAISTAVQDWVQSLVPGAQVQVVYNALSAADRHIVRSRPRLREDWEMGPETPLLGCAGQLVPWKRQELFLRAGAEVIQQVPTARLVIIGTDLFRESVKYLDKLYQLAEQLGIADHVLWTGHCDDMPSCLAALDVLLHTAEREPLGRVILEAMAVGVPPVAFADAGPAELIEDGVSGLLVPENDVEALAEAAVRILRDHELALQLHDGALTRAAQFTAAEKAAQVVAIYRELLARRTA